MSQEYTPEQVDAMADNLVGYLNTPAAPMLRAYAATLRQAARVDEGMVERVARAIAENGVGRPWDDLAEVDADDLDQSDMMAYARAAIEAALSAQPAEDFDARKYVRHLADVLEAGAGLWQVDGDLARLGAAIQKATAAQPAERQGEAVPPADWRPCSKCQRYGRKDDCTRCGGSGWRKKCTSLDCIEYGCNGGRHCYLPRADVDAELERQLGITHPAAPVGVPDGMVLVPQRFVDNVRAASRDGVHPRAVPVLIEEAMDALEAAAPSAPQGGG